MTARLKNFLMGMLLVLNLKESLLECATVTIKSEVILIKVFIFFEIKRPINVESHMFKVTRYVTKVEHTLLNAGSIQCNECHIDHLKFSFFRFIDIQNGGSR